MSRSEASSNDNSNDNSVRQTGQVKWFNHTRGYGFLTNLNGGDNADIFVHHTQLKTKEDVYKTLYQGEYVEYLEEADDKGKLCAVKITGIQGNTLMCEVRNNSRQQ